MNHMPQQTNDMIDGTAVDGAPGDSLNAIELRIPGTPQHLPAARVLAAELAARLDFALDEIDDLRMAVDEACGILVAGIKPNSILTCTFNATAEAITTRASAVTRDGKAPSKKTFGWQVISALVDEVSSTVDENGSVSIGLKKCHREAMT